MRAMLMLVGAAMLYVFGGVAMKLSESLTVWRPSVVVYVTFAAGATLQTLAMSDMKMSASYAVVLGLEAVLALGFAVVILKEHVTVTQVLGTMLVVAGIIILKLQD